MQTIGGSSEVLFDSLINSKRGDFWEDPDFPSNNSSLFLRADDPLPSLAKHKIEWKRPHELAENPQLFIDGIAPDDFYMGHGINNGYFLASLTILASVKEGPQNDAKLIYRLFSSEQYFKQGLVGVRFFKNGQWMDVAVDTRIPCLDGKPAFVQMKDPNKFWTIFLEKAYAKLHGCYEAIEVGAVDEALADLTGGASGRESMEVIKRAYDANGSREEQLKARDALVSRGLGPLLQGAVSSEPLGSLPAGQSYAITRVEVLASSGQARLHLLPSTPPPFPPSGQARLHLLPSTPPHRRHLAHPPPHAEEERRGRSSNQLGEDPSNCTPQTKQELVAQAEEEQAEGGFWVAVDDFVRAFAHIAYVDLASEICSRWSLGATLRTGGSPDHPMWVENARIRFTVTSRAKVHICVSQEDTRMKRGTPQRAGEAWKARSGNGYHHAIGFTVLRYERGRPLAREQLLADHALLLQPPFLKLRTVSAYTELHPGEYVVVPTTSEPLPPAHPPLPISLLLAAAPLDPRSPFPIHIPEEEPVVWDALATHSHVPSTFLSHEQEQGDGNGFRWRKVGREVPSWLVRGQDYKFSDQSRFEAGEWVVSVRTDRAKRIAKVYAATEGGGYTLDVDYTDEWTERKEGVPASKIGKLAPPLLAPAPLPAVRKAPPPLPPNASPTASSSSSTLPRAHTHLLAPRPPLLPSSDSSSLDAAPSSSAASSRAPDRMLV